MRCMWSGVSGAPSTSATQYAFITATRSGAWSSFENTFAGNGGRSTPLSENITITRLTMWVATAPGGAASWNFRLRTNGADSTISAVITGAATTATWTGRQSFTATDLINLASVPSGSPASAGSTYWIIEYYTAGNFYLVPISTNGVGNSTGTWYFPPFGGAQTSNNATAANNEVVIPTNLTVTKYALIIDQQASGTFTHNIRNNTTATDSSFSVSLTGSATQGISAAGSLSFSVGDTMVLKETKSGGSWASTRSCMTVVPSAAGEIVQAFGNVQAPSTTAVNYNTPVGGGNGSWNATESAVSMRMFASRVTKFYVKLATAPGAGKSRAFTLRSNSADTAVATTISGTATTNNNTTSMVSYADGDLISIATTPTGTPAATAGVRFGFVQLVHQKSSDFFHYF